MRRQDWSDTIVAVSTPGGRSARAIVRMSGREAVRIAATVFRSGAALEGMASYSSCEGIVRLEGEAISCPATAYVMLAPRSYTREDVVELHTVGSPPLLGALVDALVGAGARPAEAGEFTRRAFLNGRIDLTQAEAVQGVIEARSRAELRVSQSQLGGAFRGAVEALRGEIVGLLAEMEACIDFVEDDIEFIGRAEAEARVERIHAGIESLAGAEPAAAAKEGVRTVLCGLPNAGKSSLLNALAGEDRAIVTAVPGTTRDTVEHPVEIGGIAFRLIDTAGMRRTRRKIEAEAVERASRAAETAGLLILVIDGSEAFGPAAEGLWDRLTARGGAAVITVLNKSDLGLRLSGAEEGRLAEHGPVVAVSALRGDGLAELRAEMVRAVRSEVVDSSAHGFWVGARHRAALRRGSEAVGRARAALSEMPGFEFAAADLREALEALGEIIGATTGDEVLDAIFSRFCIGK